MALTKIGATLGGSADVIQVTQNSHGLSLGFPVKVSGNGTYAHASADTAANAEAIGIIIATTTNTMTIALGGRITVDGVLPSGNLAAGTVLFMATSASKLVSAPPTGNNEVIKPMAVITYLNSEMIMLQHRGEVISTAGITLADGSVDNDAMADNAINTEELVADAVTNAKLANMAAYTIKGNATSSSANPTDISLASATGGYSIDDADIVLVYDANGSALKTITRANFVAGVGTSTSTWIPTHAMRTTNAESVAHWDYAALYLDASNTDNICVSGVFAAAPTAVKWIFAPTNASGDIVYTITTDYASVGQTLTTHAGSVGNTTLATVSNIIQALDVNSHFSSAVAGDFFGMIFSRIGGNGSDTLAATLAVFGLLIEY